jgi:hypothetical protein
MPVLRYGVNGISIFHMYLRAVLGTSRPIVYLLLEAVVYIFHANYVLVF